MKRILIAILFAATLIGCRDCSAQGWEYNSPPIVYWEPWPIEPRIVRPIPAAPPVHNPQVYRAPVYRPPVVRHVPAPSYVPRYGNFGPSFGGSGGGFGYGGNFCGPSG